MGLKIEVWSVAYRTKKEGLLIDNVNDFKIINNGISGWYADPFLFEHNGETYLFAEYFSYFHSRGIIVCAKYDKEKGKFEKYKPIIQEDYHLSYPLVFSYKGNIYMMPESEASNTLYVYKAVSFPDKWEKLPPLMDNIRIVDTTPFTINDKIYALGYCIDENTEFSQKLLLLEFDGERFIISPQGAVSDDVALARPGGKIFERDGKRIRVSQDCLKGYGNALNFIEICEGFEDKYSEKLIKKINPEDICMLNGKQYVGIHTYNFTEKMEVIDLKSYKRSYYRVVLKLFRKVFGRG